MRQLAVVGQRRDLEIDRAVAAVGVPVAIERRDQVAPSRADWPRRSRAASPRPPRARARARLRGTPRCTDRCSRADPCPAFCAPAIVRSSTSVKFITWCMPIAVQMTAACAAARRRRRTSGNCRCARARRPSGRRCTCGRCCRGPGVEGFLGAGQGVVQAHHVIDVGIYGSRIEDVDAGSDDVRLTRMGSRPRRRQLAVGAHGRRHRSAPPCARNASTCSPPAPGIDRALSSRTSSAIASRTQPTCWDTLAGHIAQQRRRATSASGEAHREREIAVRHRRADSTVKGDRTARAPGRSRRRSAPSAGRAIRTRRSSRSRCTNPTRIAAPYRSRSKLKTCVSIGRRGRTRRPSAGRRCW